MTLSNQYLIKKRQRILLRSWCELQTVLSRYLFIFCGCVSLLTTIFQWLDNSTFSRRDFSECQVVSVNAAHLPVQQSFLSLAWQIIRNQWLLTIQNKLRRRNLQTKTNSTVVSLYRIHSLSRLLRLKSPSRCCSFESFKKNTLTDGRVERRRHKHSRKS